MRQAIFTAVTTIAITVIPVLTAGQAQAACQCPAGEPDHSICEATGALPGGGVAVCDAPQQAPPPVQATEPQAPSQAPAPPPVQVPPPVESPSINPPTAAKSATATTTPSAPTGKTVALPTPKNVDAPADAVQAARNAPAATIDPTNPPPPPAGKAVDVAATVLQNSQLAVQHWGWVDHDKDDHPVLFNPVGVDMTFHLFYGGSYQDVYVPAGGRVVVTTAAGPGVYPFTGVGDGYVTSGYLPGTAAEGSTAPVVWKDVNVHVTAVNTTVVANRVTVVGHDGTAPYGRQDLVMLDDTTLARGQIQQGSDDGTVDVAATQSTPGVGPWDNGASIVNTALQAAPDDRQHWLLIGAGLTVAVLVGVALIGVGLARRTKRPQPPASGGWS